jgi:hypothetical protein
MNIAKCARASQVARNIKSGYYVGMRKFANYDESKEGIFAQQREADRRLREIQAERALRKAKGVA